jgi:hypothetical protein
MRTKPTPGVVTMGSPFGPVRPELWRKIEAPKASMMASTTVPHRVYWLIFFRPSSPSFCSFSKCGMTAPKSWMMIEAEM